jgi:hypothetical protein
MPSAAAKPTSVVPVITNPARNSTTACKVSMPAHSARWVDLTRLPPGPPVV